MRLLSGWRRPRRALVAGIATVLALEVAVGTALVVRDDKATQRPAPTAQDRPRTTPPDDESRADALRLHAVRELLRRRSVALLTRDRAAFLATVDGSQPAFVAEQGRLFDALAEVPIGTWTYEIDPADVASPAAAVDAKYRTQWWAPTVVVRYTLEGYDRTPTREKHYPTFVQRPEGWRIGGDADFEDQDRRTARGLWDFGPVRAIARPRSLVLTHPESRGLGRLVSAQAEESVRTVTSVWGTAWSQRVVILVPSTTAALNRIIAEGTDLSQIAALATAELDNTGPEPVAVGDRVVVNPANFGKLGVRGRRVVLTHEVSHVATRRETGPLMPTWLVEGLADYIGYRNSGVALTLAARELRADVRAGRLPSRLPADDAFRGDNPGLAQAYEASWLACVLLVERIGEDGLLALYRDLGAATAGGDHAAALEAALQRHARLSTAAFTAEWRRYLERQLG